MVVARRGARQRRHGGAQHRQPRRTSAPPSTSRRSSRRPGSSRPAPAATSSRSRSRRAASSKRKSSLALVRDGKTEPLTLGEDANISMRVDPAPSLDAPLVFVGYGLNIPERSINDFAGAESEGRGRRLHLGDAEVAARSAAGALRVGGRALEDVSRPPARSARSASPTRRAWTSRGRARRWRACSRRCRSPTRRSTTRAGQQLSVTMNPAHADKLFAGSGHTFAELLALVDAGQPVPALRAAGAAQGDDGGRARATWNRRTSPASCAARIRRGATSTSWCRRTSIISASATPINGDRDLQRRDGQRVGHRGDPRGRGTRCTSRARSRRGRSCSSRSPAKRRACSDRGTSPRIPRCRAASIVANVNTDMFLPLFPLKTLMVLGLDESDLGAGHPRDGEGARPRRAGRSGAAAQPLRPQRSVQLHPGRHSGAGDEGRLRGEHAGGRDRRASGPPSAITRRPTT